MKRVPALARRGGPKELRVRWPSWPVWGASERRALLRVLDSGQWTYGPDVATFERAFARFQRARHGVACATGTAGLETALGALGVGPGDEVIVPAFTFIGSASPAVRSGATVVWADVLADTLCLDPADVARKVTRRTRAVIPVHLCGAICDMDALKRVTRPRGIALVEDACHAWGSAWKGKGAGALGDCGVFSFQVSKNITAGEGGMVLTDSASLAVKLKAFTHCGRRPGRAWYEHFTVATNCRMTTWQAAVLLAQLERLAGQTRRRQANARILDRGLSAIPGIRPQRTDPRITRRAYHMYCFRLDLERLGASRARFLSALGAEGVPCMPAYGIPAYANPVFTGRDGGAGVRTRGSPCPEAERAARDTVWITHPNLLASAAAMRGIVRAVAKVVEHREELGN